MPLVMLLVFAFTLFLSATLLFLIEPMVGKMMLPLLGGTPAVWNTCMVFFQAVLLAGYAFAHASTRWLGARRQARLQLFVLLLPIISFAVNGLMLSGLLSPNEQLIAGRESNPVPALLLVLTLSVGLPMLVVCTSAPLLTRWFSSTDHPSAQDPYFLYGASNLGSMLTLIAYPLLVEPYLSLKNQQIVWVIGYALLALSAAACALLMWRAKPAREGLVSESTHEPLDPGVGSVAGPSSQPVTWLRRLRWVILALVPSSLMLGVTTYITTDIAAIPLLWIPPLALYLLTFIIVFAHISPRTQSYVVMLVVDAVIAVMVLAILPGYVSNSYYLWGLRGVGGVLVVLSLWILKLQSPRLIHKSMILAMPLLILLLLFVMLSEYRPSTVMNIVLQLATLFVTSMVCHGELAEDRPEPKHLTDFFLLMSVGGVVGGLFNALLAPTIFDSLAEYPLMLMVACLMVPSLSLNREGIWTRRVDVIMAALFVVLGGFLLWLKWQHSFGGPNGLRTWEVAARLALKNAPWKSGLVGLIGGLLLGLYAAYMGWGGSTPTAEAKSKATSPVDRLLDVLLPVSLLVLVLGLFWGLRVPHVTERLSVYGAFFNTTAHLVWAILTFGLPAVLCYTFVDRPMRFGMGVGAILLASSFSTILLDPPMHQERSFFGVVRVEGDSIGRDGFGYDLNRMVHGTTLHGIQFDEESLHDIPLSYFHRTGPAGEVFYAFNKDPNRRIAVIGLGTGTLASYALPGQTFDFYDIDPVVVDIAFDTNDYFTFVEDAQKRGVDINLVLGDARLTFQPKGVKKRLKPLGARKAQYAKDGSLVREAVRPARTYGADIQEQDRYGVIIVDAFSSDAIPMHLITKEAVKIYFERLEENGILCMHISNRYLDLQPVLANIAEELGYVAYHMNDEDDSALGKFRSHWVAIARKNDDFKPLLNRPRWQSDADQLSLLAVAVWPACGGFAPAGAMAHAFWRLAEEQSRMEAAATGYKGDLSAARSEWVRVDQKSVLEEQEAKSKEAVALLELCQEKNTAALDSAQRQYREATKVAETAKARAEEARKALDRAEAELGDGSGKEKKPGDTARATVEQKKTELVERESALRKAQEAVASAIRGRKWYEGIGRDIDTRISYEKGLAKTAPSRLTRSQRYGLWTDDYSNLIAALNF